MTVKERLAEHGDFLDVGILRHGFAAHMRDYDVLLEAAWVGTGKGTYRLRFLHCPLAATTTAVPDSRWRESWSEVFVDQERWVAAGQPEGYVWGACWSLAYPGLTYVEDSPLAREWSARLGHEMHEVTIETDAFALRIVFHDFTVTKLSEEVSVIDEVFLSLDPPGDEPPA